MNCPDCGRELSTDYMHYSGCGEFNELVFYKCIECDKAFAYGAKGKLEERHFPATTSSCAECIHYIKTKKFCPSYMFNITEAKIKNCKRE